MCLYDSTFHLLKLNFLFFSWHDAVHMLCLGLGTKPTWLVLGNDHGMTSTITDRDSLTSDERYLVLMPENGWKYPHLYSKNTRFCHYKNS